MSLARLIIIYTGRRLATDRIKATAKRLKQERKRTRRWDLSTPIMRHVLAKEYGWSYRQSDELTMREVEQAMALLGEDIEARKKALRDVDGV